MVRPFLSRAIYSRLAGCIVCRIGRNGGARDSSRTLQQHALVGMSPQAWPFFTTNSGTHLSRRFTVPSSIIGTVTTIIFEKDTFKIALLATEGSEEPVKIVGDMPGLDTTERITVDGEWGEHFRHGKQFKVISFKRHGTMTAKAIADIVKGVGVGITLAKRIVEYADQNDIDLNEFLSGDSGSLEEVKGIGKEKACMIRKEWTKHSILRDMILRLSPHGFDRKICQRIVDRFKGETWEILETDPYRIYRELSRISFETVDGIAIAMGIKRDDQNRICAGLYYALEKVQRDGHTAVLEEKLIRDTAEKILHLKRRLVQDGLNLLVSEQDVRRKIVGGALYVQHPSAATAEETIAASLKRIQQEGSRRKTSEMDVALASLLSDSQQMAIKGALKNKVSIITGGPGTGKTRVLSDIVSILNEEYAEVLLTAFTGVAARRLGEETESNNACTIHRLLQYDAETDGFFHNEHNFLVADFIIVDEVSMISTFLMASLLQAVPSTCHVVLVGDVDQLPSIGAGAILYDMIMSKCIPVTHLKDIFRQGHGSSIVDMAHSINRGDATLPEVISSVDDLDETKDFEFLSVNDSMECSQTVVKVYEQYVKGKLTADTICETQILVPSYKGEVGITNINAKIQGKQDLEVSSKYYDERRFAVGDKVIHTKNDYSNDLRNGSIGIIEELYKRRRYFADGDKGARTNNDDSKDILDENTGVVKEHCEEIFVVNFYDNLVEFDDTTNLELAYALSVHKSQGSEYPVVILVLTMSHGFMLNRKLLYTAVTRGKEKVIVIGHPAAYVRAVRNKPRDRCTLLLELLKQAE